MLPFQISAFRQQFPLLSLPADGDNNVLCYLDNAATTQKMASTIDVMNQYYQEQNANVHRGSYRLSSNTTALFEAARLQVKSLLHANSEKEIIWTKGTTEAINLVANSWGLTHLQAGDEILLSYAEHHANIVPWQIVAEKVGAVIRVIPLLSNGIIDVKALSQLISSKTKLIACSHISNVIGKINPIQEIIHQAKSKGITTLIDGAQAIAHLPVNVKELGCDFYVFSSHKMYGPTGLGVLYGKESVLNSMPPYQGGGEMIKRVSFSGTCYNELPFKFEAGTPNIAAVLGFQEAIKQFLQWDNVALKAYENEIVRYAYNELSTLPSLRWLVTEQPDIGIFSFTFDGIHHQDVASFLDSQYIAVRCGHHCAMPLMEYLNVDGCIRVSLTAYNTKQEVDRLVAVLKRFTCLINGELVNQKLINKELVNQELVNEDLTNQALTNEDKTTPETVSAMSVNNTIDEGLIHKKVNDIAFEGVTESKQCASQEMSLMIEHFSTAKSWDAKHRLIMLIAKELIRLPKIERSDTCLISGCESKAWLVVKQEKDGTFSFIGDSDARVIRGLMHITLKAYQGLSQEAILSVDIEDYFQQLGLIQHLSPSRSNGLYAIVEKIKWLVQQ